MHSLRINIERLFLFSIIFNMIDTDFICQHLNNIKAVMIIYKQPGGGYEFFYRTFFRITNHGVKLPVGIKDLNNPHIAVTDKYAAVFINGDALGSEKFSFFNSPTTDEGHKKPIRI